MTGRTAFALCALLTLAGSALGQTVYRWVDERGNVHFGEMPPPGARDVRRWKSAETRGRLLVVPGLASGAAHRRAPPPEAAPSVEPATIDGKTQSEWRSEAQSYERRIEALEEQIERERDRSQSGWPSSLSASRFEARKQARLEALARKLEAAELALDDLEDRARVAGVLPGWLR